MRHFLLGFSLASGPLLAAAQSHPTTPATNSVPAAYVTPTLQLTLRAALAMAEQVRAKAATLNKQVAIAVVDASGQTILLLRDDGVGPHNVEAARRKAYTALSTKTATLLLSRNARINPDTQNLNTLPELLLLSGGVPLRYHGLVIGGVGVAGGGSPENDDLLGHAAALPEAGIIAP